MHGDNPRSGVPLSLRREVPVADGLLRRGRRHGKAARSPCADVMDALAQQNPVALRERVQI